MNRRHEIARLTVALALLAPALAFAAVGKVSQLQGKASRTGTDGVKVALAQGSEIEVGDSLKVEKGGALKLLLNDESVLAVGPESQLVINEAEFSGLERKGFSAKLMFGAVWAKVKKVAAGSEAKFEVTTERAVAGVRGTIFRVDATKLLKASTGSKKKKSVPVTVVRVTEGKVAVDAQVRLAQAKVPAAQGQTQPASTGPRRQVAGPGQISKDEWEKKFVELQRDSQVTVGEDLWEVTQLQLQKDDPLAKFVAADNHE